MALVSPGIMFRAKFYCDARDANGSTGDIIPDRVVRQWRRHFLLVGFYSHEHIHYFLAGAGLLSLSPLLSFKSPAEFAHFGQEVMMDTGIAVFWGKEKNSICKMLI
ncbi:Protein of unknown function [Cotesia congregata]|uniref:Uncharacterized protein n=1 Tax=Cotesia congregata TaxID=51543 RepID=A0A8J2HDJ8_COTCN|nr:Protein of unknown function [Cotesia congregata]